MGHEMVHERRGDCSGCGACSYCCSVRAISMRPDEEGFLVPMIDTDRCVGCGRCREICPMTADDHLKCPDEPTFYVAIHESPEVLFSSTSGGAFTALSDAVLAACGVIYGVVFDGALDVVHARAVDAARRDDMRISKYVQSRVHDMYAMIRDDLAAGRDVLFTGTPCQTAGVRAIFGEAEGLYLCDLICHGVPSPLFWREYREMLGEEHGSPVRWVAFRTKEGGWHRGHQTIYHRTEGSPEVYGDDRFFKLYFSGRYILRPSCHSCPYGDTRRASDVTIADYWGIEKFSESWLDRRGVSLIMTHTRKGEELLRAAPDIRYEARPREEQLSQQRRLRSAATAPADRQLFWDELRAHGLAAATEKIFELHPELRP